MDSNPGCSAIALYVVMRPDSRFAVRRDEGGNSPLKSTSDIQLYPTLGGAKVSSATRAARRNFRSDIARRIRHCGLPLRLELNRDLAFKRHLQAWHALDC